MLRTWLQSLHRKPAPNALHGTSTQPICTNLWVCLQKVMQYIAILLQSIKLRESGIFLGSTLPHNKQTNRINFMLDFRKSRVCAYDDLLNTTDIVGEGRSTVKTTLTLSAESANSKVSHPVWEMQTPQNYSAAVPWPAAKEYPIYTTATWTISLTLNINHTAWLRIIPLLNIKINNKSHHLKVAFMGQHSVIYHQRSAVDIAKCRTI